MINSMSNTPVIMFMIAEEKSIVGTIQEYKFSIATQNYIQLQPLFEQYL